MRSGRLECLSRRITVGRRNEALFAIGSSPMNDERRACRILRRHRSTQRKVPIGRPDEEQLVADMIELTRQYGRYGYPLADWRLCSNLPRSAGSQRC